MSQANRSLSYSVRLEVVGKHLGELGLMLALLSLVPLVVSIVFGELAFTLRYLIVILVLGALSLPTLRLKSVEHIQTNEALVVGALAFLLGSMVMTIPLSAGGVAWQDALFESVSGITTTGLTTLASVEDKSATFLFSRSWMQWYGGLGIAVLSVALLMGQNLATRRLIEPERPDALFTTARGYARQVLIGYTGLTLVGFAGLWAVSDSGFAALVHTLSAVSTGGFSSFDDSLMGFETAAPRYGVTLLTLLGALPLIMYYRTAQRGPGPMLRDPEVRTLVVAVTSTSLLIGLTLRLGSPEGWLEGLGDAVMLGVSAQTGSGFTSLAPATLGSTTLGIALVAMAVGGTVGSTSGGIKLLRVLVAMRVLQFVLRRSAMPDHAVLTMRLGGRDVEQEDIRRALMLMLLLVLVILGSWVVFLAYGYAPLDALFEVVSAVATVGLSTGITRPELEAPLKLLLCVDMLLGRLEVVAFLVLLYPQTWFGKRAKYP
jgi:trk system potassium uptake protein TrkH